MLPLKLVRSLVSGDEIVTQNPLFPRLHRDQDTSDDDDDPTFSSSTFTNKKTPLLLFLPTHELVSDTFRLASIARALGMDLHPNPSHSHIFFSWPYSPPPPPPEARVPLPFPSFATASLTHLRLFAALSRGYFKLAFLKSPIEKIESLSNNNWRCTSLALFAAATGERVESMEGFSRALLGKGWALFKTNCCSENERERELYLYRKLDAARVCGIGDLGVCSRARELRLPAALDFRNVPLRILQYILLMTDQVFYLA